MGICYICRRNDDEVKKYMLDLLKKELEEEEQFVKLEMEDENKKILDLQKEWEDLKNKASKDISSIMGNDIFYLLKNVAVNQNVNIKEYFDKAGVILGSSINSLKVKDIEKELNDKLDKIMNLGEYNKRLETSRKMYHETISKIENNNDWFVKRTTNIIDNEIKIEVCCICDGLIKR